MKRNHKRITGRCLRCNHHIWLPETLEAGMGKICKKKGLDEKMTAELQAELKQKVREILDLQKKGLTYKAKKQKAHSSLSLWKKNKSLVEGW